MNLFQDFNYDEELPVLPEGEPDNSDCDPCSNCHGCILKCRFECLLDEDDAFQLLDFLITDIKRLEADIVRWRQVLLKYLPPDKREDLFSDILSDLSSPVELYDFDTYQQFMDYCHHGENPRDNPVQAALLLRLRDGTDETSIHYL